MLLALIKALQDPSCYPHEVSTIETIETQVSWVVLTGKYAYKFKKELNFGFLDFSTLKKRQFYCEEELRLNQRLAPDIYQSVVAIIGPKDTPKVIEHSDLLAITDPANGHTDTADNILEYAVRMLQFDPNCGLDQLLRRQQFEFHWINQLGEQLATFHQKLPTVTSNSPWGKAESVWSLASDNFTHTIDVFKDTDQLGPLQTLYRQVTEQYQALIPIFSERRQQGYIRECHGDLHLGNVTLFQGKLRLFDCIEFNLEFRWIDTASDLAFLLMDLEANDKHAWANLCLNRYLAVSGDYQCLQLLDFYKSFRAMVRAKVATLGNKADLNIFKHYLLLTQSYQLKSKPQLILMHGLSGSGKSYLSLKMIEKISAIRISSETERKRLHKAELKKGKKIDLHSPEINARLSAILLQLAEKILTLGYTVIVDGTFLKQHFRQKYFAIATKLNCPITIVSCQCEKKLMQARLVKGINTRSDDSSFSLERLEHQHSYQQPISSSEKEHQQRINTDDDQAIDDFLTALSGKSSTQVCTTD